MNCMSCVLRNATNRALYNLRLQAALDDLVARVANGSLPESIARHVAHDHKVSEEALLAGYEEHVYLRRSRLESVL